MIDTFTEDEKDLVKIRDQEEQQFRSICNEIDSNPIPDELILDVNKLCPKDAVLNFYEEDCKLKNDIRRVVKNSHNFRIKDVKLSGVAGYVGPDLNATREVYTTVTVTLDLLGNLFFEKDGSLGKY